MKNKVSIQLKAALLLVVFSMNILVGFACAVGVDMGFNHSHHDAEIKKPLTHIHADGKKHEHKCKCHHHKKDKDDCCSDQVIKFSNTDKSLAHSVVINPVFFSAPVPSFFNAGTLYYSLVSTSIRYFVRSYHPPIQDIRIAIQSFQI